MNTGGMNGGGKFYQFGPDGVDREAVEPEDGDEVISWVCRRVEDFNISIPAGAAFADCSVCGAPIVYNPARTVDAPKVCMQCAGLIPLPIPVTS